jgi:hypothetical protein
VADPPATAPNSYTINQGSSLVITSCQAFTGRKGVLCNDTDVDSSSLLATLCTAPSVGALTSNGVSLAGGSGCSGTLFDGSFMYTPPVSFTGTVTFTYKADDHGLDPLRSSTQAATVTITVKKKSGK